MELGMSHPHDLASINDVNKLVNSKPLARLIEVNKIIFFMIFFHKDDIRMMGRKLYLTDILINMSLHITLARSVFTRCQIRVRFKRPDKMRLIGKIALVSYFGQRKISMMN